MEFASVAFIWAFLPLALIAFYALAPLKDPTQRIKLQNICLLGFSYLFYMWAGVKALLLLLLLTTGNYGAGIWIDSAPENEGNKQRKRRLIVSLLLNVLLLAFFKYTGMILSLAEIFLAPHDSFRSLVISLLKCESAGAAQLRRIAMPLAISFLVFQSISYLCDVYSRKTRAEKNWFIFALYLSFFAQMTQGPIMRFQDLGTQLKSRSSSWEQFASGVRRFCFGLGKKVIIANTVASAADRIWGMNVLDLCTAEAWLGTLLYTLQIYYDFSGYSDMAVGIGRMFGIELSENFDYPYTSLSVQEFWRRWHISLSSWFRDYIYIPLGGNRGGLTRTLLNLFVVFLVTGIWHGANLTFICWGLLFAFLSIFERLFLGKLLKRNPIKPINWAYAIFAVSMGWVLFRAPSLYHALKYYGIMFRYVPAGPGASIVSYFDPELLAALVFGVLFAGLVQRPLKKRYEIIRDYAPIQVLEMLASLAVFVWSLIMIVAGSYNPSIYGAF